MAAIKIGNAAVRQDEIINQKASGVQGAPEARLLEGGQQLYAGLLAFGSVGEGWPGAELNAAWYLRNAKIFAKLRQVAEPGDRVLVLFGAGHVFQLREFVRMTKGFVVINPRPYLLKKG